MDADFVIVDTLSSRAETNERIFNLAGVQEADRAPYLRSLGGPALVLISRMSFPIALL